MTPDSARNIEFVANTDLNGRGDGVQVMVHKGHAFVGHMFSDGFTIVDDVIRGEQTTIDLYFRNKLISRCSPNSPKSFSGSVTPSV